MTGAPAAREYWKDSVLEHETNRLRAVSRESTAQTGGQEDRRISRRRQLAANEQISSAFHHRLHPLDDLIHEVVRRPLILHVHEISRIKMNDAVNDLVGRSCIACCSSTND